MAAVRAPPETWHTRLATRLADVQRAVAELRAVCEEPAARQTLQASQRGYAAAAVAPLLADAGVRTANAIEDLQNTCSALAWRAPPITRRRLRAVSFAALPRAVALHIFATLPSDARARAALVCRDWRSAVAERSLWTRLVLSPATGVWHQWRVTDATLRAAAARAPGQLVTLVLENCGEVTQHARLEVVRVNAGSLSSLRYLGHKNDDYLSAADVEQLVLAAPQLQLFAVDLHASAADATRLLRNDAPFQALRVCDLLIRKVDDEEDEDDEDEDEEDEDVDEDEAEDEEDEEDVDEEDVDDVDSSDDTDAEDVHEERVLALAAAMAAHASLKVVTFTACRLDTPVLLDTVCSVVLERRLRTLQLQGCGLSPASVPALTRLIRDGSLVSFLIHNDNHQLLDASAGVQLADAIATNRQLHRLDLAFTGLWLDAAAAATVLQALVGHPTLVAIDVSFNEPYDQIAAGVALGALVAANAPTLDSLHVESSFFGDAGLGPLMDALPHNTYLRHLSCYNTCMSVEFAHHRFVPAVQANTSLRKLEASSWWNDKKDGQAPPAVLQAEALVAARSAR